MAPGTDDNLETPNAEEQAAEDRILAFLTEIGARFELHRHPPVFTVEEAQGHTDHLPGLHVKNMFLKDKAGQFWLVTCRDDRRIKIRDLEKQIGARKMSFGKPEALWETLGVRPGAVTPLALLTDRRAGAVRFVIDAALEGAELINCHPLHNRATLALSSAALNAFLDALNRTPLVVDFDALEASAQT